MKSFKVSLDIFISAGGKHIQFSSGLLEIVDPDDATNDEIEVKENTCKDITLLKRSYHNRHGNFL